MSDEPDQPTASDVLAHPTILRGAWSRVDAWYRQGELAPQPELSRWRLFPEAMLADLAEDLRDDAWRPEQWRQVPYPKKGARLRHYMMPTVRDQVAFMAHMVAIGPILDQQVANFAFGNRWYRPIAWDRRQEPPRWIHRPYPVLTNKTYLPYSRSHGLFRRVAHWTVARMTGAALPSSDESGRPQLPEDYDPENLPPWTTAEWWQGPENASHAFWVALDIELAYPAVQIDQLAGAIDRALTPPADVDNLFDGCPSLVSDALAVDVVRVDIGRRLTKALGQVTVDPSGIPRAAWAPPRNHLLPRVLDRPYRGIPTGLAISGMLLNAAFLDADQQVIRYLGQSSGERRGAIVRFADDMYVLSRSAEGVFALVEAVHSALSGVGDVSLATPNQVSNLCINFGKIKPDAARDLIGAYLVEAGWRRCPQCEQPLPPAQAPPTADRGLLAWWSAAGQGDHRSLREALERSAVAQEDVGPFVTDLVERLSEVGTDTLRQRFGEGARDHLARLHELARFDIDDEQVRPDTRRAFAVNRLARAWLPRMHEADEERRELRRIRDTVSFVVDHTPWKFSIWRAVVRCAARRPLGELFSPETDEEAAQWLSQQLVRIAYSTNPTDTASWANTWPEGEDDGHARGRSGWRHLYLSYVRAAFWHALADVARELGRHAARLADEDNDAWVPAPILWTARAVPDDSHESVAVSLGDIDKWVDVLYPTEANLALARWPWEADEFVGAVLAIHPTTELADGWRSAASPGSTLRVPSTPRLGQMPKTTRLLSEIGRLQTTGQRRNRKLDNGGLANLYLGRADNGLGALLFPTSTGPRIKRSRANPQATVAAGLALGCFDCINVDLSQRALPRLEGSLNDPGRGLYLLAVYERARRLLAGQKVLKSRLSTVHRLLWGKPANARLSDWKLIPWETPALGLPTRVAAGLLAAHHGTPLPIGWVPGDGPLTWLIDDTAGVLAAGRRQQFESKAAMPTEHQLVRVARSPDWELLPHPAYYLPLIPATSRGVHAESYVVYCDVLLFLTALDGGERILDGLTKWGVGGTPFVDRWSWRSRIHLPLESWRMIECILRWNEYPDSDVTALQTDLLESLPGYPFATLSGEDFQPERVDVVLDSRDDMEIVRTIHPAGEVSGPELPPDLRITGDSVGSHLVVRVGQVLAWPDRPDVVNRFPAVPTNTANAMIEQVANVFLAPSQTAGDAEPNLVVLPELAVPQQEIGSLRDLVRTEGKGAVAGLYWRELKPPYPSRMVRSWACFVNEAELIVPIGNDAGPPTVRWFRVRKPNPAHTETGLARALSKRPPRTKWRLLPGERWYRFVHPEWGDFTVAICADLIDAGPWRALRGELLHLLMVAFNKDVDLFDNLTWVRAYENYVNVVSVNHGLYGGSFLWTPRRTHGRELARLRGSNLVLTADVKLPVRELYWAQRNGVAKAIVQSAHEWQGKKAKQTSFKSPPPGFRRV